MSSTRAPGDLSPDRTGTAQAAGSRTGPPLDAAPAAHTAPGHGPGSPPTHASRLADDACEFFTRWRDGDDRALDALVHLLTPVLWHLARAYRVDTAAAEDAVQATWLSLVRSADRIAEPQAVLRWLSVTVQREAARASRSAARTRPTEPELMPDDGPTVDGPESVVMDRTSSSVLWRHVTRLSERCQRLLRVIAFSDRPEYGELSKELGMPVGSIGPTRGRCLAKLRESLANDPAWSRP
ncbi:RNA polymerase sigma factor [Thalassiella azotivora]